MISNLWAIPLKWDFVRLLKKIVASLDFSTMEIFHDIVNKRTTPGVLIVNEENEILHSNQEALAIIPFMQPPSLARSQKKIPAEIATLCERLKLSEPTVSSVLDSVGSGEPESAPQRGPYALRAFYISNPAGGREPRSIMVLMERIAEKHEVDLEKARREYELSKRELEVLQLICRGMSNREIAQKMFICEYTVKDHIKKIMKKMNVKSRSEIVAALTSEIEFRT
jgi:DNA-binding CsgD family transcriptional regulator